jgi:two-component system, chemotaxis family, protein-glutamate methylesterase/glutaminase
LADAAETGVIPAETTVMRIAEKGDHVSNDPTPQVRRVIVVGASAGGVEALSQLVSRLPRDLPAAVLVVLHIPANAVSVMPGILRRAGQLPAVHAATREPLREGIIYIAPPDRHMLVRRGSVVTTFGPRENGHRPAVDPLFRSAADSYGKDVIGVLLTGNLDDGTAGLAAIKESGGLAIVQDPEDAVYPGMPTSAIENVKVDRVLPLEEIAPALLEFLDDAPPAMPPRRDIESMIDLEIRKTEMDPSIGIDEEVGRPSGYTCPECHGGLWEIDEGSLVRYRCRVGHAYSADSLVAAYGSSVEAALWAALRSLAENAAFAERLARRAESMGQTIALDRFMTQAKRAKEHARTLNEILAAGPVTAEPEHEVVAPD